MIAAIHVAIVAAIVGWVSAVVVVVVAALVHADHVDQWADQ